jgi:fatty-acyl-CoA synthase
MGTIVDTILSGAAGGERVSILDINGAVKASMTWAQLHERARRMTSVLHRVGIGPGSRVGLLADTNLDLVAVLQAVWLAGAAITVLAPPTRRADSLPAVLADARLDLVVVDPPAAPLLSDRGALSILTLAEMSMAAATAEPALPHRPDPDDLAILQYTSGSTRTPRGVPVTHAHLAANLTAIKSATRHVDHHPGPIFSWLPLYHDLGLIGYLALPMSCGCPVLLQSPAAFLRRPAGWLEVVSRYRVTSTAAPNFAYGLMTVALAAGLDVRLDPLKFLLTGGEPVDAAMMRSFVEAAARRGLDPKVVVAAYGLAESTLGVTFATVGGGLAIDEVETWALEHEGRAQPQAGGRALVRLGKPVPGLSLRIADRASGAPLPARSVGHVEVSGTSVVGHYWGEPKPPPGAWLRTGDLGYLADGDLVVCGREKDVLFAAGRNIFPQDIEAAVAEVPGVRPGSIAAFGVPGPVGDRLVVAVEVRAEPPDGLRRGIAEAILAETGLTPHAVLLLPAGRLPKTTSGKLRRAETRLRYEHGDLTA